MTEVGRHEFPGVVTSQASSLSPTKTKVNYSKQIDNVKNELKFYEDEF